MMTFRDLSRLTTMLSGLLVTGCSSLLYDAPVAEPPRISPATETSRMLRRIPPALSKTVVSVYDFQDLTGQLKPNSQFAEYSKAVTQGGLSILNKALMEAGDGTWFTVVERGGLKDLVQERQIVRMMRDQYPGPNGEKLGNLPPLIYAGVLIEGGVVGYDANIVTGGAGANYLGVGGDADYRRDIATVDLRAINIATGEILLSVTAEKTVYSTGISSSIFKYVAFDKLFQMETGFTVNEPPQLAVRKAIQSAVYALIMEGARKHYWQFAEPSSGREALGDYLKATGEETGPASPAESPSDATHLAQPPLDARPIVGPAASGDETSEKTGLFDDPHGLFSIGDKQGDDKSREQPVYPVPPVAKSPR